MTDFDSLREDLHAAREAIEHGGDTNRRAIEFLTEETKRLWADQAALRDELNSQVVALSNRIEGATRDLTLEPPWTPRG